MKILMVFILSLFTVANLFSQQSDVVPVEKKVRKIKASEYKPSANCPKMPQNIVEHLEKANCLIPQSDHIQNTHNAFQIQFKRRGQNDWAVLCSQNGFSSIWIFWNELTSSISKFAEYPDSNSRVIGKDTSRPLTESNKKQYGEIIPLINSWGIDEQTPEGNFVIYYIYQKQLVVLQSDIDFNTNLPIE